MVSPEGLLPPAVWEVWEVWGRAARSMHAVQRVKVVTTPRKRMAGTIA